MWLRRLKTNAATLYPTNKGINGILKNCRRNVLLSSSNLKDVSTTFPNAYKSDEVEFGWYKWWLDQKCFQRTHFHENFTDKGDAVRFFSMVLPPPNVTSDLHLGHALTVTIQDALIRWHKAKGYSTLWIPGYDHAGIATQVVVEKKIKAQTGRSRHQIGKTQFIKEVNEWKDGKIESIRNQLQQLGSSLDWSKECFTMDKDFALAVEEAFIRLYEEGLIRRENALVNWCCHLQSAISDIEVDNIEMKPNSTYHVPGYEKAVEVGKLTLFAYRLANSQNEELVVATSRPETMFGDVAVAVHPEDQRYSHWVGQHVLHPFDGRLLPIIADRSVDPKFGTGCVKITPGHSYHDFEVGKRHDLPCISIMDKKGNLNVTTTQFQGMYRFEARKAIIDELKLMDLFRGFEGHASSLPVCSRSGDIIEPLLYPQWYLDCSEMFSELVKDIEAGQFVIQPEYAKTILLNWLSEKRKWCISRQLWWGHQIPAYFIKGYNNNESEDKRCNWVVGRTLEEATKNASKKLGIAVAEDELVRDEDVLDTWFSSALFPLAALGWPGKDAKMLEEFYPLSLMETGNDIIFFWVARMAILGKKLIGTRPFNKVLLHGMICDTHGRKMSKSLGNVIDPTDVLHGASLKDLYKRSEAFHADGFISQKELEKSKLGLAKDYPTGIPRCGADALRFSLLSQDVKSNFINVDIDHVHSCSKFCNKMWQSVRFLQAMEEKTRSKAKYISDEQAFHNNLDRWIFHRLHKLTEKCNAGFESHDFHLVTTALRSFWYTSFCDIYLEGVKPVFYTDLACITNQEAALCTLFTCIQTATIALAPIMPFLAEELYHRLNMGQGRNSSVSDERYPQPSEWEYWHNPQLEERFSSILVAAAELRQIKVDYSLSKCTPEVSIILTGDANSNDTGKWNEFSDQLNVLSRCRITGISREACLTPNCVVRIVNPSTSVAVKIEDKINSSGIIERLNRRQISLKKELERWDKTLQKANYCNNTPAEIQRMHSDKINSLRADLFLIERNIDEVKNLVITCKE